MISKEKILGGCVKSEGGILLDKFKIAVKYYFPDAYLPDTLTYNGMYAFDNQRNRTYECGKSIAIDMFKKEELTLEDFNPKTKVDYVKCDFQTTWEAVKSIEDGGILFKNRDGTYRDGTYRDAVIQNAISHPEMLYKKIEKEIGWKEEIIDFLKSDNPEVGDCFLEMCRIALQLSGEL